MLHRNEGRERVLRSGLPTSCLGLIAVFSLILGACGGGDHEERTPLAPDSSANLDSANLDIGFEGLNKSVAANEPPSFERPEQFHLEHDKFIAIDEPPQVAANSAPFLAADDPVLGFVFQGRPRAYAVRALAYHHVVNDLVDETPLAVVY